MKIRTGKLKKIPGLLLAAILVCAAGTGAFSKETNGAGMIRAAEEEPETVSVGTEETVEMEQADEKIVSAGTEEAEKTEQAEPEITWAETEVNALEGALLSAESAPEGSWEKAVGELIAEKELEEDEEKTASGMSEEPVSGESGEDDSSETEETFESDEASGKTGKKGSIKLSVKPEDSEPKAGQDLLYNVTVENTGEVSLENLIIQSSYGGGTGLYGVWDTDGGYEQAGYALIAGRLEKGEEKLFYLTVPLPESYAGLASLNLYASGEYAAENGEKNTVSAEAESEVTVGALQADFEVTKTADRTAAVPGDQILFQICIRNTGELTLHSVITTEKFQMEGMSVKFLEKEGVVLNDKKTKARIAEIAPGEAVSLNAAVTLPKDIESQELINEVTVTTEETGEQTVTSEARVQIYGEEEENPQNVDTTADNDSDTAAEKTTTAVNPPKTGDETKTAGWILLAIAGLTAAGTGIYFRLRRR